MSEFYEAAFPSQAGEHPFLDNSSWLTQPSPEPFGRRWYDEIGHMTLAIQATKNLPPVIQNQIAQNLNRNIDHYRQNKRMSGNSVSLGSKAVLGLYKSGLKQRWYDKSNPELSRAITMMSTLPEAFIDDYAKRIVALGHYFNHPQDHQNLGKDVSRTVATILNHAYTQLEETESGIRISEGTGLDVNNPNKHIVTTEHHKKTR